MKAAINGVPNASISDGWWDENRGGGWTIGDRDQNPSKDAKSLYGVLRQIAKAYYNRSTDPTFLNMMVESIAGNGSFFNTNRMVKEYNDKIWKARASNVFMFPVSEEKALSLSEFTEKLVAATFKMGQAKNERQIEHLLAQTLLETVEGSTRISRYSAHRESVRIMRRWTLMMGGVVGEQEESSTTDSGFHDWTIWEQFSGEVMGTLLENQEMQIVPNPKKDQRCYRDGHLVSSVPFVLVPEIVNGQLCGIYKLDFRTGECNIGERRQEFIKGLMDAVSLARARVLDNQLATDLEKYSDKANLISWGLTLLTAGGLWDMPRYSTQTNRAAVFLVNDDGKLKGFQAVGDSTHEAHSSNLGQLSKRLFAEGVENHLRTSEQRGSSLEEHIKGKILGDIDVVQDIIRVDNGVPLVNAESFDGGFDIRTIGSLTRSAEEIFKIGEQNVRNFLLVPIKSSNGHILGVIYADNAFHDDKPPDVEKLNKIAKALGNRMAQIL
ncbi:MAG: hypothetical protein HQ564_03820 [Candidatus Saganbacteria bacterium]|nr:hypothetical protein [Candidatus Saganbacteria bacterium]